VPQNLFHAFRDLPQAAKLDKAEPRKKLGIEVGPLLRGNNGEPDTSRFSRQGGAPKKVNKICFFFLTAS